MSAVPPSPIRRQISPNKKLVFSAILIVVLYLMLEVASFFALRYSDGKWYSWSSSQIDRTRVLMSATPENITPAFTSAAGVVHPYIGYAMPADWEPTDSNTKIAFVWSEPFSNRPCDGFPSRRPVVQKRSENTVIVGLFGGSVAEIFYHQGIPTLFERLKEQPDFRGKELIIVCLACGGYKQPQQLMALNYLLTMGGQLDLLINIDGFNEIAFHAEDNLKHQIHPVYPRAWNARVGQVRDHKILKIYGRAAILESNLRESASAYSNPPMSFSPTCHLMWLAKTRLQQKELRETKLAIEKTATNDDSVSTGRGYRPDSEQAMYEDLVAIWEGASRQMRILCEANGIRYYHFLQPNQYLEGSKTFTANERSIAYNENHIYREGVRWGYPLLRKAGERMLASGERFFDLSDVFVTTQEQVYIDDCCHFGVVGNQIMAERIARAILEGR